MEACFGHIQIWGKKNGICNFLVHNAVTFLFIIKNVIQNSKI